VDFEEEWVPVGDQEPDDSFAPASQGSIETSSRRPEGPRVDRRETDLDTVALEWSFG
jgi:hypothetical protein